MHCEDPVGRGLADKFFQSFLDIFYDMVLLRGKDKLRAFYNHSWDSEIFNEKQTPFPNLHLPKKVSRPLCSAQGAPIVLSVSPNFG